MRRLAAILLLIAAGGWTVPAAGGAPTPPPETGARVIPAATNLLSRVLPPCDNRPVDNSVVVTDGGKAWTFYVAAWQGRYAGAAFESAAKGHRGVIRVLVGVSADGTVRGIAIVEQNETPGFGALVADEEFCAPFAGKDVVRTRWKTTVNGGDIDAVSGATFSSEAVVTAVKSGLDVYSRHRDAVRGAVEPDGTRKASDQ